MDILLFIGGIIDFKYRKIPNWICIGIGVYAVFVSNITPYERITAAFTVVMPLFIIALATDKLKGGDVKYLSVCALALGITGFLPVLALTALIALVWSILTRQKSVPLAFVLMLGYTVNSVI